MEKITPRILNGSHLLLFSETFCADPHQPITVSIPAGVKPDNTPRQILLFISLLSAPGQPLAFDSNIQGDAIYFRITNYTLNPLIGTIKPWEFTLNGFNLFILFSVTTIGDSLVNINLSVYARGEVK